MNPDDPSRPVPPPSAEAPTTATPAAPAEERKRILAAAAPWLAAWLNLLPGLGTGYIYQRRWRAYWITSALASLWFLLGVLRGSAAGPQAVDPRPGLGGLLLLAVVTAAEAFLAGRRARMD